MQAATQLCAHQRPFDLPTPPERVTCSNGNEAYRRVFTESERLHMAEMLGIVSKSIPPASRRNY